MIARLRAIEYVNAFKIYYSSLNNHLSALRGFFEWLDGTPKYGHDDYRWRAFIENIEPNDDSSGRDPVDPEFVPSENELAAIRRHANHPRDKALIEYLAGPGTRVTLACQLKCGDVTVNGDGAGTFRPTPGGLGQKKVPDRKYRLHESQRYLRQWLNEHHPEAPDPHSDAPLFPIIRGYDEENREKCALSPSGAETVLKKAAEAAGIDPARAHPHNFRKTAVTRMRLKHGMLWDPIQLRTGWTDQSLADPRPPEEIIRDRVEGFLAGLFSGLSKCDFEQAETEPRINPDDMLCEIRENRKAHECLLDIDSTRVGDLNNAE